MARGRMPSIGSTNLHVGAAVAEIEGLYTALRGARDEHHRERILADLAEAGRRLTARTHPTQGNRGALRPRSRWERRRLLAARGADLVATFATDGGWSRWARLRNRS
ncbi:MULTISPECIES: hypothetical protein [Streptomyces]|uniref:Uncharacterized protein n=1 Tax=Streptomyces noursei TaxID=1971 RepID=A0A059WEZ5_STRNR|nr:hypothetical protein [Streptomyces noursei]AKA07712.1 hypothetical protein SAZ_39040 [Streptomyces noursei ZPM]AIA07983.1 hypothetical protein DC74_7565 [Streptomyces noursei]MCE4947650.1 hypothetical protein [Streptomyces noursei]UWS76303.1 hypothetical protein N1H47_36720 [Streptomyces noursei]GCB95701.1 hypothetical protein SALB_08508 [Streptomyces noursei]